LAPLGHHIRSRLADNRVILQSDEQRRLLARVVLEQGRRDGVLAFSLPDTHLHLETLCSARAASRLSQRIGTSLSQRLKLAVSFVTYPHRPVLNQQHLSRTFRYIVTQFEHHGVEFRSSFEATNIPDLLGLRLIGRYTLDNVRRYLPRVRPQTLLEWTGLTSLRPADGPISALVDAAMAATALNCLDGRSLPVVEARRAMLEIAGPQLNTADLTSLLGVARRTLFDLKHRPVNAALVNAIRLQLGLHQILQSPSLPGREMR
jgi:hypothetical protein